MGVLRVKSGVQFAVIAPGGFRILRALDLAAASLPHDLVISSGTDGCHSGELDPHHRGEAYDVRSHDLEYEQKPVVLRLIMAGLGGENFFGFLEAPDTDNEHFHLQVRKGTVFP